MPAPGAAEGAWLSLDERGAFGPVLLAHVDVLEDGSVHCVRRQAKKPDADKRLQLSKEEQMSLLQAVTDSNALFARPVKRTGIISDVGTTTICARSLTEEGKPTVTLIIDGQNTVEPSQGELMAVLTQYLIRCVEQP